MKLHINAYKSTKARVMNIPKHVLNCPWVGQQHDILSFCEHLILRLWSIFSQNDNSAKREFEKPGPGRKWTRFGFIVNVTGASLVF